MPIYPIVTFAILTYILINVGHENTHVHNSVVAVCHLMTAADNAMWNIPSTVFQIGATITDYILYPMTCVERMVGRLIGLPHEE